MGRRKCFLFRNWCLLIADPIAARVSQPSCWREITSRGLCYLNEAFESLNHQRDSIIQFAPSWRRLVCSRFLVGPAHCTTNMHPSFSLRAFSTPRIARIQQKDMSRSRSSSLLLFGNTRNSFFSIQSTKVIYFFNAFLYTNLFSAYSCPSRVARMQRKISWKICSMVPPIINLFSLVLMMPNSGTRPTDWTLFHT